MNPKVEKAKKNIPELRFPEFEGEWEEKRLGDVATITTGSSNREDSSTEGEYIFFDRSSDVRFSSAYNFDGDAIIVAGEGLDFVPRFFSGKFDLHQRTYAILDAGTGEVDWHFLYFSIFQHRSYLRRMAVGSTMPSLRLPAFKKMPVVVPELCEQQKIATFLTAADEWIENLKAQKGKWEEYKKGMMQKIFSQELRFKNEDGNDFPDWEEKKFEEIVQGLSTKSFQIRQSEIRLIGKYPVVDQGQELIAGRSNESIKLFENLPVIIFGDHTTILKFVDFPFVVGADGTKLLKSMDPAVCSDSFLYYSFIAFPVETEGYKRHFSILKNRSIFVPRLEEQQKIATFLTAIDEMIHSHQQRIAQAEEWKNGLMQRMFV